MTNPAPHVLLLGFGAIGRQLVSVFDPGEFQVSALVRDLDAHRSRGDLGVDLHNTGWEELVTAADLVVECAGVAAAAERGPGVIAAGRDLVLTSVGALADPDARRGLLVGPGHLHVTSGAIGGFDLWAATAAVGGLDEVRIRTRKHAPALVQPWMDETEARLLREATEPLLAFTGDPAAAIEKFPGNVNVAVALAWATRGRGADDAELLEHSLRRVRVELLADPDAERSRHEITASGAAGEYFLSCESAPSPVNPRTSGLTALSVAYTLRQAVRTL